MRKGQSDVSVRNSFLVTAGLLLACVFGFVRVVRADSQTFNFTGVQQTFTVPAGVNQVTIQASGAQGGNGCGSACVGPGGVAGPGGNGGSVTATISVTPGETLGPPGIYHLRRGQRDQALERLTELEQQLSGSEA